MSEGHVLGANISRYHSEVHLLLLGEVGSAKFYMHSFCVSFLLFSLSPRRVRRLAILELF